MTLVASKQKSEFLDQLGRVCAEADAQGSAALQTGLPVLMTWLDESFEQMGLDSGARRIEVSDRIERSILERAGFFESFPPQKLVETDDSAARTPAVCYQCYPQLAGHALDDLGLWTCAAECGRNEDQWGIGRFRTFQMREIVLVGSALRVRGERDAWMSKMCQFARSLELEVALFPAADCFFATEETRGRRLLQQVKGLKYELQVLDGPCAGMAIASFNLHETFFARRFRLTLRNGSEAYSGCIAFGLERWALALAQHLGLSRALALTGVRTA